MYITLKSTDSKQIYVVVLVLVELNAFSNDSDELNVSETISQPERRVLQKVVPTGKTYETMPTICVRRK